MLSFRRVVFCGVGVLATLALSAGITSATPISYQISTAACFDCDPSAAIGSFNISASDVHSSYVFTGVAMANPVLMPSDPATVALGTLRRDNDNYAQSLIGNDFMLQVTFVIPIGVNGSPEEFTATIAGTQGQPGFFVFPGFQTFSYQNGAGSGTFQFRVNDTVTTDPNGLQKNHTDNLEGTIRNATFCATGAVCVTPTDIDPAPEPGSLILLGTGLVGAAAGLRRRLGR